MTDVFISYSRPDHADAALMAAYLESEGLSVWYDRELHNGDHYRDEIAQRLREAGAVLTIWSRNSISSEWVRAEASMARALGKLVPAKRAEISYSDIPLPFGELHTNDTGQLDELTAALRQTIGKKLSDRHKSIFILSAARHQWLSVIGLISAIITFLSHFDGVIRLGRYLTPVLQWWHDANVAVWASIANVVGAKVGAIQAATFTTHVSLILAALGTVVSSHARLSSQDRKETLKLAIGLIAISVSYSAVATIARKIYGSTTLYDLPTNILTLATISVMAYLIVAWEHRSKRLTLYNFGLWTLSGLVIGLIPLTASELKTGVLIPPSTQPEDTVVGITSGVLTIIDVVVIFRLAPQKPIIRRQLQILTIAVICIGLAIVSKIAGSWT